MLRCFRFPWAMRAVLLWMAIGCSLPANAQDNPTEGLPVIEIFMPSPCIACIDWGAYLADNGFKVIYKATQDMEAIKRRLHVPKALESVHTAVVSGYFVEGHAHAEDIHELLREKPKAWGISVPGLPRGAPGRDFSNPTCETACTTLDSNQSDREVRRDLYETLLIKKDGSVKFWARH